MKAPFLPLLSILLWIPSLHAEDEEKEKKQYPIAGHSLHGEVFNEGPRQAAVLIPGTGKVHFPVTTDSEKAQQFFTQGVGQLHGYWDFEAERSFRQVAKLDPDCAMAYWGMAAANFKNLERGKGFIEEARKREASATDREKAWIAAYHDYFTAEKRDEKKLRRDLVRDLENLALDDPDDVEPLAFLASLLYSNTHKGHAHSSHLAVEMLIREIHEKQPDHPAHHFRIHLWDRENAERALGAAAACGPSAPGIAHMWHMPGHIYSKLHRYQDAAWQQEASARIDHAHMMNYQVIPDQIHNFAHNNEWLIRNLNHLGRVEDAIDLACNMIELPRLPKLDDETGAFKDSRSSWTYGRTRLRDTLVRYELWTRLERFLRSDYLAEGSDVINATERLRLRGIIAFETGKPDAGRDRLAELQTVLSGLESEQTQAGKTAEEEAKAEEKKEADIKKAREDAEKAVKSKIDAAERAVAELSTYDAIVLGEKSGEELAKAIKDTKSMETDRKARLLLGIGEFEEAIKTASSQHEVYPTAIRALANWRAGEMEEAADEFEKLRSLASQADLDLPVFQRLAPLVEASGSREDWRHAHVAAKDLGERPPLDELGDFRWQPQVAPAFNLKNHKGETFTLESYANRPVILIFYLGSGCTHCMEQLTLFKPWREKFKAAGMEFVAVSIESAEELAETWEFNSDTGEAVNPFLFPVLGDGDLSSFRDYRAYDDFEDMPLHGTFLLDGEGRIRWLDISHEPFMHPEFLLEESQRLLSFDPS